MQTDFRKLVGAHLGIAPDAVTLTPIPSGKHNTSYFVDVGADRYVLRISPPDDAGFLFYERRMMRQEPHLHTLIAAHTEIPIPEILMHDFSRKYIDRDLVLMKAMPGRPLIEARWLSPHRAGEVLLQVGRHLAQLHQMRAEVCLGLPAPSYGYLGAHQPMEAQPDWGSAFVVMWHKMIDDVVASGCYDTKEADRMRALVERFPNLFDRPVDACLLHMDVWAQNILVDGEGKVTGLLDFDRALWGDVEIEYAVLDYCGISEPTFWTGYGKERDNSDEAQIRKMFYLLYELQKYMPIRIWRRKNQSGAMGYKRQCLNLAGQLENL